MKITSPVFVNNGMIPVKYTCDGDGVNPPLIFDDVPAEAKSLVLIVDDPDAPVGLWTHWVVVNINPSAAGVAENSVPADATQTLTSSGRSNWGPPCPPASLREALRAGPPSGTHRYFFKLYALSQPLAGLNESSTAAEVGEAMRGKILAGAELVGLYKRK